MTNEEARQAIAAVAKRLGIPMSEQEFMKLARRIPKPSLSSSDWGKLKEIAERGKL